MSLEYNLTAAQFGNTKAAGFAADAARNARGMFAPADMHWIVNHRLICMTKFNRPDSGRGFFVFAKKYQ